MSCAGDAEAAMCGCRVMNKEGLWMLIPAFGLTERRVCSVPQFPLLNVTFAGSSRIAQDVTGHSPAGRGGGALWK